MFKKTHHHHQFSVLHCLDIKMLNDSGVLRGGENGNTVCSLSQIQRCIGSINVGKLH